MHLRANDVGSEGFEAAKATRLLGICSQLRLEIRESFIESDCVIHGAEDENRGASHALAHCEGFDAVILLESFASSGDARDEGGFEGR